MNKKKSTVDITTEDFQNLLGLQKRHNDILSALDNLASELNSVHRDWLKKIVDDAVVADAERQWIETEAEAICRRHEDDWFAERQSIKTPLGTAKFHRSTALDVPSETLTMELLRARDGAVLGESEPPLVAENYVRVERSLNLESLGTLSDAALKELKVRRVTKETFALMPASVDIAKAIKDVGERSRERGTEAATGA